MSTRAPVLLYNSAHPQYDQRAHLVDVPELLKSKLLITGGSGSGKSRALRALLEQLAGQLQVIVFDFEGDLVTLTAVHPFLVAGDGGHVPAHPEQASALATRIMSMGASLICNLSELSIEDRHTFVAEFLRAMMAVPRDQWRPCLIAIDEVQLVCPERTDGDPVSAAAVVDVAARGRKRGYCLVVTSQRVSKIRKDLVAECHNRLYGFISLPADITMAARELGLEGRARAELKGLARGEFFALGPALSRETIRVRNADVQTREPESGTAPALPRSDSIQALLEQLGTLPAIEKQSAKIPETLDELTEGFARADEKHAWLRSERLRAMVVRVRQQLIALLGERTALKVEESQLEVLRCELAIKRSELDAKFWDVANVDVEELDEGEVREIAKELQVTCIPRTTSGDARAPLLAEGAVPVLQPEPSDPSAPRLNKTMRAMLATVAKLQKLTEAPVERDTLAAWVGMSPRSGTFSNYLSTLVQADCLRREAGGFAITAAGLTERANTRLFGSLEELHRHWLEKLGKTPGLMLQQLIKHPVGYTRSELAKRVGISPTSGTYANYLSELRKPGLITTEGGHVQATALLFPRGLR